MTPTNTHLTEGDVECCPRGAYDQAAVDVLHVQALGSLQLAVR